MAVLDVPRVHTQSQMTGAVLFLALLRTLDHGGEKAADGRLWSRYALLAGMTAAALATLRMNYLPVAAAILVLAYIVRGALICPLRKILLAEGARWPSL